VRVALHTTLLSGQEEAYEAAHATVPGELANSLRACGVREWSIWRSGRHLFHLIECDDFSRALAVLEHDPANVRWQVAMSSFVVGPPDGSRGADVDEMRAVWSLSDQGN